ncbi:MAG: MFS transporter [archaeon]|nr:MFS transporter [archaeon]
MTETVEDPYFKTNMIGAMFMAVALLAVAASWMSLKMVGPFILFETFGENLEDAYNNNLPLVASYIIAQASVVIIAGKMMDRYGEKKVFWVSSTMFVLGSLICAISFDLGSMLTGRIMAGFGAGGIFAVCVSCVGTLFSIENRGRMQGIMTAAYAIGSFTGMSIGVWFYDQFDWRYMFVLFALLGTIGGFGCWKFLPEKKFMEKQKVDWIVLGAMFITLLLIMVYSQAVVEKFDMISVESGLFVVAIAVAVASTVVLEKRSAYPITPQRMHKHQVSIIAGLFVIGFVLLSVLQMVIRIYLINYNHEIPDAVYYASGMLLLIIVGGAGPSLYCCHHITKLGLKPCVRIGCAIVAIALILSYFFMDKSVYYMMACMVLLGCGLGFMVTELLVTLQNITPVEDMGATSSTAMGIRLVGIVSGLAIFSSLLHQTIVDDVSPYLADIEGMDSFLEILIYIIEHAGTLVDRLVVDYTNTALECMIPGIIGCIIIFILSFFMDNVGTLEDDE